MPVFLQRVASGEIRRLIVTVPPQHGKSRLVAVEFPAWLLGRTKTTRIVVASYAKDLSHRHSRMTRDRIMSDEHVWLFNTKLAPANQSVDNWSVVGGGTYKAVGIGSSLSGHPADLLIIDDPHKDFAEATSAAARENVWDWYRSVAYTRLAPWGSIIVIMTRWHVDDLVGRLTDPQRMAEIEAAGVRDETWTVVNLPAIAEENDPIGRKPGEALWPEYYSIERLKAIKQTTGTYIWSALYCGRPMARGGNIIRVDKIKIIPPELVPEGVRWTRFWDLAATEARTTGPDPDMTAGAKVGIDRDGNCYVANIVTGRWWWPQARERIRAIAEAERILVGVEAQGGFETAYSNLREVLPPDVKSIPVRVETDKLTRALPWIALAEAGKFFLVSGDWNVEFIRQAEEFPAGKHDDMIDAVSGGYALLTRTRKIMVA